MIYYEKSVSSEQIYSGKIIKVRLDKVEMPDGSLADRELVEHPGGVGIVAVTDENEIILVKQFRKPFEKDIYEIPAGKLEPGEDHRECGIRELSEETGCRADSFEYLGFMYPSPGFLDEVTHIYLATGLHRGSAHPDDDEFLDVLYVPVKEVRQMIMDNRINDGKTVFGVLKALEFLKG
ncbi:MAG TPA: NUDIX hydrolase [Candidatus Monoglobus merdigallinarum]|uniref:NUDIX hydrolase n=1 Tax=Candidatus Monoglobus merdigallinarum TaxID=2838698 RepID=A0A9D1PPV2_9FIRM|nr:NUDIX hydrolase [Candidatus Monoglobus merdigallinarum]